MRFIIGLIIGCFIGWLFPVEGPVDYVYDDYTQARKASVNVPMPKEIIEAAPEPISFWDWLINKEEEDE